MGQSKAPTTRKERKDEEPAGLNFVSQDLDGMNKKALGQHLESPSIVVNHFHFHTTSSPWPPPSYAKHPKTRTMLNTDNAQQQHGVYWLPHPAILCASTFKVSPMQAGHKANGHTLQEVSRKFNHESTD
jgi:hypothetical protein